MRYRRIPAWPGGERILAVEAGQVNCPRRGVVDLECCWVCPAYDGFSGGRPEGLVCKAEVGGPVLEVRPTVH
jgi:hypothetical protein